MSGATVVRISQLLTINNFGYKGFLGRTGTTDNLLVINKGSSVSMVSTGVISRSMLAKGKGLKDDITVYAQYGAPTKVRH